MRKVSRFNLFVRLVSGSGDIKLTKDGNVLLHEMVRLSCYLDLLLDFLFVLCAVLFRLICILNQTVN